MQGCCWLVAIAGEGRRRWRGFGVAAGLDPEVRTAMWQEIGRLQVDESVESADQDDAIPKRLQRLGDEGELEVAAGLKRTPVPRRSAMWMPNPDESPNRCRRGQATAAVKCRWRSAFNT